MRFDINRLFKLRIRGKLAIAFAGLSILPVLVVGILGISSNVRSLQRIAIEDLEHDLRTVRERVQAFFRRMEDDAHFLTVTSSFRRFLEVSRRQDEPRLAEALRELLPELRSFAERKKIFYQIKFIDRGGREIFTIEDQEGVYRVLPADELNQSGSRFYVHLVAEIPADAAMFVPVELWRVREQRLLPAISCIYPIYRPEFSGILIFHIYAKHFFELIEQRTPHDPAGTVSLVNADGYYLYDSEKKKDWNRLLASKDTENLKNDLGEETTERILSGTSPLLLEVKNEIVASAPLFSGQSIGSHYTILKSVSKAEIFAPVARFKRLFLGLLGVFLLGSLLLAFLATQQFTRPIQKLRGEVDVIAKGNFGARVNVQTYDEIQDLAHQFNVMAESLEQRQKEIARQREKLEEMVRERTKALEDEKNKMQVILDNVPSGFILLDKEYTIQSASAALERITGRPVRSLLGKPCYQVIDNQTNCNGCPAEQAFRSGKLETRVTKRVGSDGEERFFEHVSVPLKKDGHVESILEIITDVTERKRLQDQLVRSERLAATGEIAAVIAHEMRNSLTSVRMILQLLAEADYLNPSDRESLEVALDSLGRMERVVHDLLRLARPTRLDKQPADINQILVESVEFARHQVAQKRIEVDLQLAPDLPSTAVDVSHMKEAIVNLILNASQAIQDIGNIRLHSRVLTLSQEMRDLGEIRVSADGDDVAVQEIVLKKGTRVLEIQIADTGSGIPEEHLQRIFDPFFTTKPNGTGLGLSFVKRVVNEHRGVVRVRSSVGTGSVFTLLLPVA